MPGTGAPKTPLPALKTLTVSTALIAMQVVAAPVGMVSDNGSDRLSIFNADLDIVMASLDARPGMALGDCVVSGDENTGITTSSDGEITFVDLAGAGKGSSLEISNLGVDMALSPDDRFLVLAGGGALQQPISVVDTSIRSEVATTRVFADHTSVEFCDNGTMLITTTQGRHYDYEMDNALYDAHLDADGSVVLGGSRLSSGAQPNNASCAPGSLTGVLLDREGGLSSFTLPEMELSQHVQLSSDYAVASTFSRDGRSLFVRTRNGVETFDFNPATGDMTLRWAQETGETSTYYGIDQIAIHPDGSKLYVDGGGSMLILNTENGDKAGEIPMGDTTGICFANNPGRPIEEALVMD